MHHKLECGYCRKECAILHHSWLYKALFLVSLRSLTPLTSTAAFFLVFLASSSSSDEYPHYNSRFFLFCIFDPSSDNLKESLCTSYHLYANEPQIYYFCLTSLVIWLLHFNASEALNLVFKTEILTSDQKTYSQTALCSKI